MNTHLLRWDALIFGVLFALIVGVWATLEYDILNFEELVVAGPIALIVAGIAGIALTLRRKS